MTKIFEDQAAKITKALEHRDKAVIAFNDAGEEYRALAKAMHTLMGDPPADTLQGLIRTWGPKIATYAGLPGAAVLLTGLTADTGAFSGILGLIGKVFGIGT